MFGIRAIISLFSECFPKIAFVYIVSIGCVTVLSKYLNDQCHLLCKVLSVYSWAITLAFRTLTAFTLKVKFLQNRRRSCVMTLIPCRTTQVRILLTLWSKYRATKTSPFWQLMIYCLLNLIDISSLANQGIV